ncbi:2-hydroxyacyl-CoA dehydratase subunit D [Thermodesulfobacteriota bacterium]
MEEDFIRLFENRHKLARKAHAQGNKIIGYIYTYVPQELIHAAGAWPLQLTEDARTHGGSMSRHFPDYVCDYLETILDEGIGGTYDYLDGLIVPHACESLRGFYGMWRLNVPTPLTHIFAPPNKINPDAQEYLLEEFMYIKTLLEDLLSIQITASDLEKSIGVYNELRALIRKLYSLRTQDQPVVSGSEVFSLLRTGLVIPPEDFLARLQGFMDQLNTRPNLPASKNRIMIQALAFEECITDALNLVKMVEDLDSQVVSDDLNQGMRWNTANLSLQGDPFASLARYYLEDVIGAYLRPASHRVESLLQAANRAQVDAVIVCTTKYCDPYSFELPYLEKKFRDRGFPVLLLETSLSMPPAQVKNRIEAFLEIL